MTTLTAMATSSIKKSASPLTKNLRTFVMDSGWPAEVARQLKVTSDGKTVVIPTEPNDVHAMEYGTVDNLPTGSVLAWGSDTVNVEAIILESVENGFQGVL